jgi:NADH-quinone oxidoreductase subunit F
MDLHLIPGASATPAERDAIDAAIGSRTPARDLLLPALQAAQARVGWISEGALNHLCARLDVPPADAYGVASFYSLLSLTPRPPRVAHVCDDVVCRVRGAERLCEELSARIGKAGEPASEGTATWLRSPCLGQCERAPAAFIQHAGSTTTDWTLAPTTADDIVTALSGAPPKPIPQPPLVGGPAGFPRRLLRRVGHVDPDSLDSYVAHGGYQALRRAVIIGAEAAIREVSASGLVGRGGAAFPTGRKWQAVAAAQARPHYVVCNADESEPGTFKDRVLMEQDPFAVIEAMTIAAFATGCETGFIYVRGEYPLAFQRLANAVTQARAHGALGPSVLGEKFAFDIDLRRGAGAYICGEETALFNSIEGLRGEPRNKPPFPVESGLFGKPTVINNVETLVSAIDIVLHGAEAFRSIGTTASPGSKLFCASGCVVSPGLYEVPFGTTLRQVIDLAGGIIDGRTLQAVLLGGAAGVFVTPRDLDLPLTFESTRAAGATLGSGVIVAFDGTIDLRDIALRIAAFFRDESCGQCVPCRVGTVRQEEALRRLASGQPIESVDTELALIDDLAQAMRDASICGLGHTASTAIQSAIKKLDLFVRP